MDWTYQFGPLSQWLFSALAEAGLPVVCVETRHMRAVLKAQINKTDRNDARGIAQMMRVGLYRPVHVKTLRSQKLRMLLTHRKLLQSKAIDRGRSEVGRPWTDKEISTLVSTWPNASTKQIAVRLHRPWGSVHVKAKQLLEMGLLEAKDTQRRSIKPDLQDFNEAKMDYCRKHNITIAQLCARLEDDDQLMTELYRLALAANLIRLHPTGQNRITARLDLGSPSVQRLFSEAVRK